MEWELSNPQVFWTDNAAHHNLAWWRWDFLFTSGKKEPNKVEKKEKRRGRGAGEAANIYFEQQRPVVYLMIALLLLNLTSLSSLSVPINTFPLRHSWNSSHINSPHLSLSVTAPSVIIAWSPSVSASQTYEQVNIRSDTKVMLIAMHFQP